MTISINNTTSEICPICRVDYTNAEREDTAKVVELTCHHFYHINCLSSWFVMNENNNQDLSCCYCTQLSMPKTQPLRSSTLDLQTLETYFSGIEQNPDLRSKPDIIDCLAQLKLLSKSIVNLLNDICSKSWTEGDERKFKNWIIANIQEKSRSMVCLLLAELCTGGKIPRTLQQEIEHLAGIPSEKWSIEIGDQGVPVYHFTDDGQQFRMRVSGKYLKEATVAYKKTYNINCTELALYEEIHNTEKFEKNLATIEAYYYYDQEILDCIQDTKNLREDISNLIKKNSSLPIERILFLIEEMVIKTKVSNNSKRTIPLIINGILFDHMVLRTMSQEVDRWKKEPIEKWPLEIKKNGICFLDKDNSAKHCKIEDFTKYVISKLKIDKVCNVTKYLFMIASAGFLIKKFISFDKQNFFFSLK